MLEIDELYQWTKLVPHLLASSSQRVACASRGEEWKGTEWGKVGLATANIGWGQMQTSHFSLPVFMLEQPTFRSITLLSPPTVSLV